MRRYSSRVVYWMLLCASVGCAASPSAPSPTSPTASPFTSIVGDYTLTIEIDESCGSIPPALRTRAYDVVLEDKGWHFMPIRMADERFGYLGGEIWPPGPDARYRFEWNNFDIGGCDYPEATGSTQLYVCGDGLGTLTGSAMSGVIHGSAFLDTSRPRTAPVLPRIGSHSPRRPDSVHSDRASVTLGA